ncbi:MAG: putative aminohydrolase SsnA [Anaerolineae bacterium]|uniref:putative aminohydrolase SsnA n=1 Tax=Candidatus Amarolinea dominans TaxID=3140696 RepID=UPI00313711AF|nr:putative aminohydrolase SsnA [Anaerolineae bacterium]MBK9231661.1 putative aminohydrolase SsnA [Anaerolineae bacterium]
MQTLITNGTVITLGAANRIIERGAVLVEGDEIRAVGQAAEMGAAFPLAQRLDAAGQLIMPGQICAHTHFYGAFARGLYIPGDPPKDFPEILRRLWWTLDKALDADGVSLSALVCLVDAIRHGTTTLIDHHASPNVIAGSLDLIADAVIQSGLRACLCYEVTDRDGPAKAQAGIEENVRFLRRMREQRPETGDRRLAATFGLHASLTLSDETLAACVDAAAGLNTGFHIHAAEGMADQNDSLSKYGQRTIDRLASRGILGPQTIVAHAIAIDAWEMGLLRETGVWVSHQPRSNMNNAVGVADVPAMLRGGVKVVLGNDGFSNNMFTEMKTAYLLHKAWRSDPRVATGNEIAQMAWTNNAALARQFFPKPIGELTPGAYADIILLDYAPITPLTPANLPWHVLFGADGSHVTTTMVAGQLLMVQRKLLFLDEQAIAARSREVAGQTWQRFWALS